MLMALETANSEPQHTGQLDGSTVSTSCLRSIQLPIALRNRVYCPGFLSSPYSIGKERCCAQLMSLTWATGQHAFRSLPTAAFRLARIGLSLSSSLDRRSIGDLGP